MIIDGVRISSLASIVPPDYEDNMSVPGFTEDRKTKIIAGTGVRTRYIAGENVCTSDLVTEAAKLIIAECDLDLDEVGVLLFATQSPDYILPASSFLVHESLNLGPDVVAFDINLGCSGYVYGLYLAACLLKTTGKKYALLLAGDTISKYVGQEDASTKFLFGDAGSATLLEIDEQAEPMYFSLGSDGAGWQNLIIPAGAARNRRSELTSVLETDSDGNKRTRENLYMDGMEIFNFTISTVVPHVQKVLDELGMADTFVFHQANKYMLEFMRKSMKIPNDRFLYSLSEYGNTSSASIPVTLCAEYNAGQNGSKVLISGFGVGYSWGTAVIDLSQTVIHQIRHLGDGQARNDR